MAPWGIKNFKITQNSLCNQMYFLNDKRKTTFSCFHKQKCSALNLPSLPLLAHIPPPRVVCFSPSKSIKSVLFQVTDNLSIAKYNNSTFIFYLLGFSRAFSVLFTTYFFALTQPFIFSVLGLNLFKLIIWFLLLHTLDLPSQTFISSVDVSAGFSSRNSNMYKI